VKIKNLSSSIFWVVVFALAGNPAFAQMGGLQKATDTANEVKMWLFGFVGICAAIYLLVLALMVFAEKKQWSDVGWGIVHVCIAGASIALATWAWGLFS
jgi:hypothetical protein